MRFEYAEFVFCQECHGEEKTTKNDYCNSSSSPCLKEKFGEEEMAAVKEVIGHVFGSEVIENCCHCQRVKVM